MTRRPKSARPRPVTRTHTEAQAEQDAIEDADRQRIAARQAFRFAMLRSHGCTGKACQAPEHDEHLTQWLYPVLWAMDLIPDPVRAGRGKYRYGAVKGER